jgi:hypothetical protein
MTFLLILAYIVGMIVTAVLLGRVLKGNDLGNVMGAILWPYTAFIFAVGWLLIGLARLSELGGKGAK